MKILVVGDQHFRYELPYASAFKDGRKGEWEAVKQTIHDMASICDAVVLMGDNFNLRHNHSSVIKEFIEFLNGFGDKEVHILVGNHERYGTSTALDFLDKIEYKNWFVYNEPTLANIKAKGKFIETMMIPYMTPALLGVETKEEGVKKILDMFPKDAIPLAFAHHAITSSRLHGNLLDHLNEIVLPKEVLEQHFAHVFAGHIHSKQNLFPSIYVTGNIFTNEMGEHSKSIWVYDSDGTIDVKVDEVPLPVRGIYKIEDFMTFAVSSAREIPPHSIVKCYIKDRGINLDDVKKVLDQFDAYIIVEQYESEREKTHFEDGVLDLSVDNMLRLYAEAKHLPYADLKEGFELINK